jgi:Zn-dependent peptidase ImmA (M78 family)
LRRGNRPGVAAQTARDLIGWRLALQTQAASSSDVSRALRTRLEDAGILVLQLPMGENGCRGFSLYDTTAPVLVANTAYTTEARIFSFLQEFAHLLRGRSWICSQIPESSVEYWCEGFAASFLMPKEQFLAYAERRFGNRLISMTEEVSSLARHFRVSLRATAVRLRELERAQEGLYDRIDAEADFKRGGGFSRDNSAAAVRLREWGSGYARLLLNAEERGLLGRTDLLEYLNVSNTQLGEIRSRVEAGVSGPEE